MESSVLSGLQNIRFFSSTVVSGGWLIVLGRSAMRLSDEGADSRYASDGSTLTLVGALIAASYLAFGSFAWRRRLSSVQNSFAFTAAFAPMVMMSFALALDHTLGSAMGDVLVVGGGVLNLAVIVSSWLITQRADRAPEPAI